MFLIQNHTVCPKIETEFLGKLGNSYAFSAQKQVISKKQKRSSPKLRRIFRPKSKIQTFFSPKTGDLQKKKKKKVFTKIETAKSGHSNAFSSRIATCTSHLRHPISFGGAVFIFSSKIGLKSTKNVRFCILHRPMGRARAPPPPPLATLLIPTVKMLLKRTMKTTGRPFHILRDGATTAKHFCYSAFAVL